MATKRVKKTTKRAKLSTKTSKTKKKTASATKKKVAKKAVKKTVKKVAKKKAASKTKTVKKRSATTARKKVAKKATKKTTAVKKSAAKTASKAKKSPAKRVTATSKSTSSKRKSKTSSKFDKLTISLKRKQQKLKKFKKEKLGELPFSYNETKLVLLVRDPYWAYSYWDFSDQTWKWVEKLGREKSGLRAILRVTNLDEKNTFDVDVQLETKNWYLHLGLPNISFSAQLGMVDADGNFYLIASSNSIQLPKIGPSSEVDENWKPKDFEKLYQLSGGGSFGPGSDEKFHPQFQRLSS